MRRALLAGALTAAAAVLLVAVPSRAYVRSAGDNGLCLWWRQPVGVGVFANLEDGPSGGGCTSDAQLAGIIQSSLATWGAAKRDPGDAQACTSFRFDYRGLTAKKAVGFDSRSGASNENLIVFRHGACQGNPACGGSDLEACADATGCWPHDTGTRTIAITTTSYIPSTGEIVDADMELHDHSAAGVGYYFSCATSGEWCGREVEPSDSCISTDAASIITHEAGHMLGLDHPPDKPNATMYATYLPGSVSLRNLDVDDVNGVCAAYPAGSAPTTCTAGSVPPIQEQPKPSDGGGCSTTGGGVLSMFGVALAMASRRRALASAAKPPAG